MNIISKMGCEYVHRCKFDGLNSLRILQECLRSFFLFRLPVFCHMDGCKWRLMGGAVIVMYPLRWFLCFNMQIAFSRRCEASLNKMRCIEALCSPFSSASAQTHIIFRKRLVVCRDYSILVQNKISVFTHVLNGNSNI